MCHLVVHWHACSHLAVNYQLCAFVRIAPHHRESSPLALINPSPCWLCQQPPSSTVDRTLRLQLTAPQLAVILDVPCMYDEVFLTRMAEFYARGDHVRWGQPGVAGAVARADGYCGELDRRVDAVMSGGGEDDNHVHDGGGGFSFSANGLDIDVLLGEQNVQRFSDEEFLGWPRSRRRWDVTAPDVSLRDYINQGPVLDMDMDTRWRFGDVSSRGQVAPAHLWPDIGPWGVRTSPAEVSQGMSMDLDGVLDGPTGRYSHGVVQTSFDTDAIE